MPVNSRLVLPFDRIAVRTVANKSLAPKPWANDDGERRFFSICRGKSIRALLATATGLRWIEYLDQEQLIRREPHPTDARAVFVELTDMG